jgi:hypothetical protein
MSHFLAILHFVLAMHAWADRAEVDWETRADTLTEAICLAAPGVTEAAVLLAILKRETSTLRSAHAGGVRYRGPWQLARCNAADEGEWLMFAGTDPKSTQYSAEAALRVYRRALPGCRGDVACAMARYAGARKVTKESRLRARLVREFETKLLRGVV